jgi:large subunit ribosomal protein L24
MATHSSRPREQRKAYYQAHQQERRKRFTVLLSKELRNRYGRRSLVARKGDTVRIMSGSFVGKEERIGKVDYGHYWLIIDNVTLKKADGKLKQLPMSPVHVMLTKLNLTDPWRRRILKVTTEELPSGAEGGETIEPKGEPSSKAPSEVEPK